MTDYYYFLNIKITLIYIFIFRCRGYGHVICIYLRLDHFYSRMMADLVFSTHLRTRLYGIYRSKMYLRKTWVLTNVKWTPSQKSSSWLTSLFLVNSLPIFKHNHIIILFSGKGFEMLISRNSISTLVHTNVNS